MSNLVLPVNLRDFCLVLQSRNQIVKTEKLQVGKQN